MRKSSSARRPYFFFSSDTARSTHRIQASRYPCAVSNPISPAGCLRFVRSMGLAIRTASSLSDSARLSCRIVCPPVLVFRSFAFDIAECAAQWIDHKRIAISHLKCSSLIGLKGPACTTSGLSLFWETCIFTRVTGRPAFDFDILNRHARKRNRPQ